MRRRRLAALAAVTLAAVTAGAAAGGGEQPGSLRLRLAATPAALVDACEQLSRRKHLAVLCPPSLPVSQPGGTVRPGRKLCEPKRSYLLEYRVNAADGGFAGRVLVGGALGRLNLDGPAPRGVRDELDIRPGGRVLGRTAVHKSPAVVYAPPPGGVHDGQVLVLWNEGAAGYLVSVGGDADRRELARAAVAVAKETRLSRLESRWSERNVVRMIPATPVGRSARGRTIRATRYGAPDGRRRILVVGCIHGDECAGIRIVRQVLGSCGGGDYDLLAIPNLNPDGRALGTRLNGRGVDLNRNFGSEWRSIGRRGDPEHSGPRPFSEPETRLAARVVREFRPDVTIWFHQHRGEPLVRAWGGSVREARRYARYAGLPFRRLPWLAGTAPNWQNHRFPGTSSFVVELPYGSVSRGAVSIHAQAVVRLAMEPG